MASPAETTKPFDISPNPDSNARCKNNELVSRKLKKKLIILVLAGHLLLILLPFLIYTFSRHLKNPRVRTITVKLVPSPPVPHQSPSPPTPKAQPPKRESKLKTIKKEITKNKKKKLQIKKKLPAKKKSRTKQKLPTKKRWRAVKVNDIKISQKVITSSKPLPHIPKFNTTRFAKHLKKLQPNIDISTSRRVAQKELQYFDKVSSYLYRIWNEPRKAQLGGKLPTVTVWLNVNSNGRVTGSKIVKKSDVIAMDDSIQSLLNKLKTLPKPPDGAIEFEATLEVE